MELTLTEQDLLSLAEQIAPLITTTQSEPDWVKLEDIRADLFAGKAKSWIRLYVFDAFQKSRSKTAILRLGLLALTGQVRSLRFTCHMQERGCMSTMTKSTGQQRR